MDLRYHSLIVQEETIPDSLTITAFTEQGEIMAMRHKEHPVVGVQFHPESILTAYGPRVIRNFLENQFLLESSAKKLVANHVADY